MKDKALAKQAAAIAETEVAQIHNTLAGSLAGPQFTIDLLRLQLLLTQAEDQVASTRRMRAVKAFAASRLKRLHRHITRAVDKAPSANTAKFHALRITMKKQRYLAGMLGQLFATKDVERHIRRLARLQDVLGDVNDIVTADAEITRLREAFAANHAPQAGEGLALQLLHWRSGQLKRAQETLSGLPRGARLPKPFW